jgi:hypothetical protein
VIDHRKFLGRIQTLVLPYVGGPSVHAPDRRLRLAEPIEPGWWRFEVRGRNAAPLDRSEPPPLDDRPRMRGHLVGWWLFVSGSEVEHLLLPPDEEAPVLSPATGRRWHGGVPLFEEVSFEDEPETNARLALEQGRSIAGLRGMPPSLRAAWAYARLDIAARSLGVTLSPRVAMNVLPIVAEDSRDPLDLVVELQARRHTVQARYVPYEPPERERTRDTAQQRAADVLEAADATLLSTRFLAEDQMEVTFRFMGQRFISVVDWRTLHVFDSGICLSGEDEMLGLDALPSVIREAIEEDALNITRH